VGTIRPVRALLALTLTASAVLLGSTILNVALPAMHDAIDAGTTAQQWILNAYTLTFAGFLLVAGNAGDRFGLKRLLVWGTAAFAVTTAVAGLVDSVVWVVVFRALMGIAAAAIMPTTLAVILRSFPAQDRARAIAVWAASSGVAISLGPLLGGAMLSAGLWWGSVLELVAALAVLGLVATIAWIPTIDGDVDAGELRMVPVAGSLAGISLLILGFLHANEGGWGAVGTWLPALAGVVVLAGLVVLEVRHRAPLVDVALFRHASFTVAAIALTLGSFVLFGYLYFTTFYLQVDQGYTPLQTGLLLIPLSAGLVVGAPLSRRVADRIGAQFAVAAGLAAMTIAFVGVLGLGADSDPVWFMADAFVLQLGMAFVLAPGTTLAASTVPPERAGAGSALLNTLRQLGSALGVAVLGPLLWSQYADSVRARLAEAPAELREAAADSLASGLGTGNPVATQAAGAAFLDSMHTSALVAAAVCFAALLITVLVRRPRARVVEPEMVSATA